MLVIRFHRIPRNVLFHIVQFFSRIPTIQTEKLWNFSRIILNMTYTSVLMSKTAMLLQVLLNYLTVSIPCEIVLRVENYLAYRYGITKYVHCGIVYVKSE
jgi:hypothetical protein